MKLGFTGTSDPQQSAQRRKMGQEIDQIQPSEFHHGDCVNADQNAHQAAESMTSARIVIHPPNDPKARAFCAEWSSSLERIKVLKPKPYLERNHDIVDATDALLACPRSKLEQRRSGTWATIRYARKRGKPITIIFPDGSVRQELPQVVGLTP